MRRRQIGDSLLWRHFRKDDDHRSAGAESGFQSGGCNVLRSFVQKGQFVGKFTAAVSSNSILIAVVWKRGSVLRLRNRNP